MSVNKMCALWMKVLQFLWPLFLVFPSGAESQTTYPTPSLLQGSWIRARDSQLVTFASNEMSGPALPTGSGSDITDYSLYQISGNQYLIGLQGPIQTAGDDIMLYFCWELVRITDSTYKLYELTPIASGSVTYSTHRVIIEQSPFYTKTVSDACTLTTSSVAPTLLYKVSSSSATDVSLSTIPDAVQDCPADVFATYAYVKDSTGCTSGNSELDFCVDRQTARVDYTKCATPKIMYSSDGLLSCLTSYTLNSKVHILLINNDATVDDSTAYRFVCMELDNSGGQEQATVYPKECSGSTSHSLALTRTVSCRCPDGTHGLNCNQSCSDNCIDECDKVTGHCTCKPGWMPPDCEQECLNDKYGQDCNETCSENCEDVCDKVTGHCTCSSGWKSAGCSEECDTGTFGLDCSLTCGACHGGAACNRFNGSCQDCEENYIPPLCADINITSAMAASEEGDAAIIVGSAVGAVVIITIIAAIFIFLIRRRRRRTPKEPDAAHPANGRDANSGQVYQNISASQNNPSKSTNADVPEARVSYVNSAMTSQYDYIDMREAASNYDKLEVYENKKDITNIYTDLKPTEKN